MSETLLHPDAYSYEVGRGSARAAVEFMGATEFVNMQSMALGWIAFYLSHIAHQTSVATAQEAREGLIASLQQAIVIPEAKN